MDQLDALARAMDEVPSRRRQTGATRIAVVGLGSIGSVAAGHLAATGRHSVIACARRPIERVVIEAPNEAVEVPLQAITDPEQAEPVDWVLLCTKAHQTPSAAQWLARLCRRSTRVAVLQNGIGQAARTAPFVGEAAVVPTVVTYSGERLGADRVVLRQPASFDLAVSSDANGHDLAELFAGTPLRILVSDDLPALAWRKLLINSVANPLTALTFQRLSIFRRNDVAALTSALLEETIAVARADGVHISEDDILQSLRILRELPADMTTSMYLDRMAGRELETEAINGSIVAAGDRLGIPTPLNLALITLLNAIGDAGDSEPASNHAEPIVEWT